MPINPKKEVLLSYIEIPQLNTDLGHVIFLHNGDNEYEFDETLELYLNNLLKMYIRNTDYTFLLHDAIECYNLNLNKKLLSFISWAKKVGIYNRLIISNSYSTLKTNMPFEYYPWFLGKSSYHNVSIDNKNIDKRFLFLNRVPKLHRAKLYDFLESNNLLEDCYWTFGCNEEYDVLEHYTDKIYPTKSFSDNLSLYEMHTPIKEYDMSFVSIVTESFFHTTQLAGDSYITWGDDSNLPIPTFITEKTDKCFTALHPFIMVSTPYFLKHLKELGFKTFDKWWDESYDEIEDDIIRLGKICDIILEISKWNMYKCKQVLLEMEDILLWNQKLNTDYHFEKRERIHTRNKLNPPLI